MDVSFVQDNELSSEVGVLRGMHFQRRYPRGKLIKVFSRSIFDVVLDIRDESESFGDIQCVSLGSNRFNMLWISPRFAHGFLALESDTIINYKVTHLRVESDECAINCLDPVLNIPWPHISEGYVLSEKDRNAKSLKEYKNEF